MNSAVQLTDSYEGWDCPVFSGDDVQLPYTAMRVVKERLFQPVKAVGVCVRVYVCA